MDGKFSNLVSRIAAKYQKKKKVPKADGKGTTTVYEYSERQIANRNREKAERVEHLRKNISDLRKQVQKDIKSKDEHTRNVALAVGLIDKTYERVGNEDSAKDGHVGVTGWKVKHLTVGKDKITIKYVGKSGVKHEKVIDNPSSVSALKEAIKGKGDDDLICGCTAEDVNEYLKPFDVTAKDLRGYHANTEMQTRLKAIRSKGGKLPEDKKEREKKLKEEFKQALEETADAVGHEAATLKSQYLVPGLEEEFLKDGQVTEKLVKKGSTYDPNTCPVCSGPYQFQCRCFISERGCSQGHRWVPCAEHSRNVVLPSGFDTHKVPQTRSGCRCGLGVSAQTLSLAYRVAARWSARAAKKTPREKEDEAAGRLVKPAPKAKPPRHDLRRERVPVEDKDVQRPSAENDRDLSLNYKRVARQESDRVWESETSKGRWVGKNPDGKSHSFETRDEAVAYAKGEKPEVSKDPVAHPNVEADWAALREQVQEHARAVAKVEKKKLLDQGVDPSEARERAEDVKKEYAQKALRQIEDAELDLKFPVKADEKLEDQDTSEYDKALEELEALITPKLPAQEKKPEEVEDEADEPETKEPEAEKPEDGDLDWQNEPAKTPEEQGSNQAAPPPPVSNEKRIRSTLSDLSSLGDERLEAAFSSWSEADQTQVLEEFEKYRNGLSSIAKEGRYDKSLLKDAGEAFWNPLGTSVEGQGKRLALALFAQKVLSDPTKIGGRNGVSKTPLPESDLLSRSEESYRLYSQLTPELRKSAMNNIAEQMDALPKDDPESEASRKEYESLLIGLQMAAQMNEEPCSAGPIQKLVRSDDDKGVAKGEERELRAPIHPMTTGLLKALGPQGKTSLVFQAASKRGTPEARQIMHQALESMSDEQLSAMAGSRYGFVTEKLKDSTEFSVKYNARENLTAFLLHDLVFGDLLTEAALDKAGSMSPEERKKKSDQALTERSKEHQRRMQQQVTNLRNCIDKAKGFSKNCLHLTREMEFAALDELLRSVERNIGKIPLDNPTKAQIRAYREAKTDENRREVLNQLFIQSADIPKKLPKTPSPESEQNKPSSKTASDLFRLWGWTIVE